MAGKSGFTLVEVLVASVILAAGLIAVLQGFSVTVNGLDTTREVMAVSDCVEEKLAELEISSWPRREPPPRDGGLWQTAAGPLTWRLHSEALISTTNATLHRVVLETVPVGRSRRYVVATEWLTMRERR
jgi:prepilin-type N-terminal cleavage/methylation domain-containing protein